MPHLALATSSKYPTLTDDDRLLLAPLAKQGIQADSAIWDDPSYRWQDCAAVVIRSCWDYHLQPEKFLRWITKLEEKHVPVFNAAPLVRWNANKSYLRDLDTRGIATVPTFWAEGNNPLSLKEKLRDLGWSQAVVKPRISATAYRTQLVTAAAADTAQTLFDELRLGPGVMVQKFMRAITNEGEWSLVFFAGAFSHAVLKMPKAGDFRAQNDFGGRSHLADPPPAVFESASRVLQAVDPTLYARVDGVVDEGRFFLMEFELIEPALFLANHPAAPSRFADAIAQVLASRM